jgi:hypothetical protein
MRRFGIVLLFLAMLAGCSSETKPTAEESKPASKPTETELGRTAFQRLYVQARGWAADAKPFRLESEVTTDTTGQGGASAIWRGYFASDSRRKLKFYTWSGTSAEGAPERGVTAGVEDTYNPSNAATRSWDIAFLRVDSDKVYDVAQKHGGEKLVKANPKQSVKYLLDWSAPENSLLWHVIYGTNVNDAKLRIAVDATTGQFVRTEK